MSGEDWWRRIRAALGNSLVWGGAWGIVGFLLPLVLGVLGIFPLDLMAALSLAGRFAVVGAVVGGAFSAFIASGVLGRTLSDISLLRFTLGGGVVAGIFVPLFLQLMNLLSGQGLVPWELVLDDVWLSAVVGSLAAGGTLAAARAADRALPPGDEPLAVEGGRPSALPGERGA